MIAYFSITELKSLLKKMNGAPAHPEEQEMPASVHRIIKLKQMTKEKLKKRKTNKLQVVERAKPIMYGMTRPEKPAPVFTQFPGESEKSFLWRVDHTCKCDDKVNLTSLLLIQEYKISDYQYQTLPWSLQQKCLELS
uniref:Uncharacterized protein n=1 Tax=Timema cristinae TaxID=61476 RepID=A0A7R9H952_TIMCR|nr:unnamed protein product [Timema cristinae]